MVFIFVIMFIIISIIFMKIKMEIENLSISFKEDRIINKDYLFIVTVYLLQCIPIFKIKITKPKLEKLNLKNKIEKINNNKSINKDILKIVKIIRPVIKKIDLNVTFGTENAALTALICSTMKIIVTNILKRNVKIQPVFENRNLLNIYFEGIFEIKMIHIINNLYIYNKKRRVDKYERTSNRRAYAYSNE